MAAGLKMEALDWRTGALKWSRHGDDVGPNVENYRENVHLKSTWLVKERVLK